MKLNALKCPNCNGDLTVEDGLDTFFCKYCGYKIILEGQSESAYRAKTKIKSMEHEERMADKKREHEKYKLEQKAKEKKSKSIIEAIVAISIIAILFFIFFGLFGTIKKGSDNQEKELQALVDEIQEDIEAERFDTAYIKAQSIRYTADYSSDIEEKWDNIRKEVINRIIEAEKKATGTSSHKPEKDGFFDGWFD